MVVAVVAVDIFIDEIDDGERNYSGPLAPLSKAVDNLSSLFSGDNLVYSAPDYSAVPGLGEILGPGEDITKPGAAEPNIGRERPYGEVVEDIKGLPGAKVIGEFQTPWGPGVEIQLRNDIKVSARPGSCSSGPTIEITDADGNTEKNRFPEQEESEKEESEQEEDHD